MEQKKRFKTIFIALLMIGTLAGTGLGSPWPSSIPSQRFRRSPRVSQTPMVPANFSDLAEKVRPGVVNLQVVKKVKNVGLGSSNFPGFPLGTKIPSVISSGLLSGKSPTEEL